MNRQQLTVLLVSAACLGTFFASLVHLQDPPLPKPRLIRVAAPFVQPGAERIAAVRADGSQAAQPALWSYLQDLFVMEGSVARRRTPSGQSIRTLNRTARALVELSTDRRHLVLTVVRSRVPTGCSWDPHRALVERYVRTAGSFFRAGPVPEGEHADWLEEDAGWQQAWSDPLPGPIDIMSEDGGFLAVGYRVALDEAQEVRVRVYGRGGPNGAALADDGAGPPADDLLLPGNARLTALSLAANGTAIHYSRPGPRPPARRPPTGRREGDIRVFRSLVRDGPGAAWRPADPGPHADRRSVNENVVVQPLYAEKGVPAMLGVSLQGRDGQAQVVFRTYAKPTNSSEAGAPAAQPAAGERAEGPAAESAWRQQPTYWTHELFVRHAGYESEVLSLSPQQQPLSVAAASSADGRSVLFCLGHLMLGLQHTPARPGRPDFYAAQEMIVGDAYIDGLRFAALGPGGATLAVLTEDGEALLLRRPSESARYWFGRASADGGYLKFGGRRLSDVMLDWAGRDWLDPPPAANATDEAAAGEAGGKGEEAAAADWGGIGSSEGEDGEGRPESVAWMTAAYLPAPSRDSPVPLPAVAVLHVPPEELREGVPPSALAREGYLLVVHSGGFLASYDLTAPYTQNAVSAFFRARWKLFIGIALFCFYMAYSFFPVRPARPAAPPRPQPPAPAPMPAPTFMAPFPVQVPFPVQAPAPSVLARIAIPPRPLAPLRGPGGPDGAGGPEGLRQRPPARAGQNEHHD